MSLSIFQAALAIIDLIPGLSHKFEKWFDSKSVSSISQTLVELAKLITKCPDSKSAIAKLKENPDLIQELQNAIIQKEKDIELAIIQDKQNARARDINFINRGMQNTRANAMVFVAALGLILCLILLSFFRSSISAEVLGAITTVAGIFGSCLKDAFSFEFGIGRKR